MKRGSEIIFSVFILLSLGLLFVWRLLFSAVHSYYLIAAGIMLLSLIPFFISFEKSAPSARELALIAVLISLAVVSRAVFYLVPQFKPIAAVVVACGVCLGAQRGYIVGAFSAFISNLIFGQGVWTPFQMVALGLVGFLSGLIFKKLAVNRISLAAVGFFLAFVLYGMITDLSSVFVMATELTVSSVLAVYASGALFSLAFGVSTAIFLFLLGEQFIKKINRIIEKYGILKEQNHE